MTPRNWQLIDDKLCREFEFEDFVGAFAFMTQVAMLAEKMGHHPNWHNVYNRVGIELTTHDAGNRVTEADERLAQAINKLVDD